jgi:hypothetical protein
MHLSDLVNRARYLALICSEFDAMDSRIDVLVIMNRFYFSSASLCKLSIAPT